MSQTAVTPYNPSTNTIFSPTQISGCSLWLDGSDRNSMVFSGNNVASWKDKSGNGNDATASGNISNIPSINGFNAMAYPGVTNTFFRGSNVNITTGSVTGFAVFNMFATSFAAIRLISLGVPTAVDYNNTLYTALIERAAGGLNSFRNSGAKSSASYTYGTPAIACSIYDGASNYMYVNGTAGTPVASSGTFGYSNYEIGSEFGEDTLGSVHYDGYIGEIILFNQIALSINQRQQIEGYLAWKWNLQTSLPTTHPYYNNAYLPNSYPITYFPPRLTPTSVIPNVPGFTIPTTIRQYVFNPTSISGVALWLDAADSASVITSGTNVTQWNDKSGNGRNAISNANYGTTTLPTYITNKYVQIADTQALCTTLYNYTTSWSCFVCMNSVSLAGRWLISPYVTVNNVMMGMNQGINKIFNGAFNSVPSDITGNHIEYTSAENTNALSNLLWFRDGTIQASNIKNIGVAANASAKMGIGANATYLDAMSGTYQIYEILIYNTYLNTAQRQQIEGYLSWKWGLQKALPSSHPFFNFPPG